jgi:DNA-directed RNA polymerase omega subunit
MKNNKQSDVHYISQELMRAKIPNTYEAVIVAAREARRINMHNKMLGTQEDREVKVTTEALGRLLADELHYKFKDEK